MYQAEINLWRASIAYLHEPNKQTATATAEAAERLAAVYNMKLKRPKKASGDFLRILATTAKNDKGFKETLQTIYNSIDMF
jgi:hypothetical protein